MDRDEHVDNGFNRAKGLSQDVNTQIRHRGGSFPLTRSSSVRLDSATERSASAGQGENQSIVQQLTRAGNIRNLVRNASPIGDMHRQMCKFVRTRATNEA